MRVRSILKSFLMTLVIASQSGFAAAQAAETLAAEPGQVEVSLATPGGSTIVFRSDEELRENHPAPATKQIPHLVLKRNGVLTPGFERTLTVSVENLSVPATGLILELTVETQHNDPETGSRVRAWRESRFITSPNGSSQPVVFAITFGLLTGAGAETPTDYYSYRLVLKNARGRKLEELSSENAFLMESQWKVPLPRVLEDVPGAAPDHLVLYYCDMFAFQKDLRDPQTRLTRQEVDRFIQTALVPAMTQAFEVQTDRWELPWYAEWTNYRAGEDPKTLSVALSESGTWFHGAAPVAGDESISIRVNGNYGGYADLTDGILGVFHHELFHNQQRNISLHFGGNGNLAGKDGAWKMFSEGTAALASAVGQPGVEFERVSQPRSFVKRAGAFLGRDGFNGGGLNESYTEIPYHTAMYWRFLYESCGGLVHGSEDPAAGMAVIRHVLEILYQGRVVDPALSSDAAGALPKIVDLALQETPSCSFRTHAESLTRFSEAVFLLRMRNGRCTAEMEYRGCGFFDPGYLYPAPNAEHHVIADGSDTLIEGSIPSSYGIDLMELSLDTAMNHRSLRILFGSEAGGQDEFSIEVWRIQSISTPTGFVSAWAPAGEPVSMRTVGGSAVLEIEASDADEFSGMGIIITRLDAHEGSEPGDYSLRVMRY